MNSIVVSTCKRRHLSHIAAASLLCAIPLAQADTSDQGIQIGDRSRLAPSVRVEGAWIDNLYFTDERRSSPTSVFVQNIKPRVGFYSTFRDFDYKLEYAGNYGYVQSENNDDYQDHYVDAKVAGEITSRNHVELSGFYIDGHDNLGLDRTESLVNFNRQLDEYENSGGTLGYTFGRTNARLQLGAKVSGQSKQYTTNRDNGSTLLDYTLMNYKGLAKLQITDRTALDFIVEHTNINFENPNGRNNEALNGLIGVRWELASRTNGHVRIGWRDKDFEQDSTGVQGFSDYSEFHWDLSITWFPTEKATFRAGTASEVVQSFRTDTSFIEQIRYSVGWEHKWTETFKTDADLRYYLRDFEGHPQQRESDTIQLLTGFKKNLSKKFSLVGSYRYRERDTDQTGTQDLFEYDQTRVTLGVDATL